MNPITQQIIAFLSDPALPFGTEEDVLFLSDPLALQARVEALLDEFPTLLGAQETQSLKQQLSAADWPLIAQEFRARVQVASGFFDSDAGIAAQES